MLTLHLVLGRSIQGLGHRDKIMFEYPASSAPEQKKKAREERPSQNFFLENCWRDQTTIQSQEWGPKRKMETSTQMD